MQQQNKYVMICISELTYHQSMASLRDHQIREVLDEDLRANREVLKRSFEQAKLFDESTTRPTRLEALVSFNIDRIFNELAHSLRVIIDNYNGGRHQNDVGHVLTIYNKLIQYMNHFAMRYPLSQRDKGQIDHRFSQLQPLIKQAVNVANVLNLHDAADLEHMYQNIRNVDYAEVPITAPSMRSSRVVSPAKARSITQRDVFETPAPEFNLAPEEDEESAFSPELTSTTASSPSQSPDDIASPLGLVEDQDTSASTPQRPAITVRTPLHPTIENGVPVHPVTKQILMNPFKKSPREFKPGSWRQVPPHYKAKLLHMDLNQGNYFLQ
jgi:hypothetical protein